MIYYVNVNAREYGDGTEQRPFRTITEAANIAMPGDKVLVAPGIYRECVNPLNSGTEQERIIYRSTEKGKAVITGAEQITDWERYEGNVWVARIPNSLFGDYNPYTTVLFGDWYYSEEKLHSGEVYLDGKSMYEAPSLEDVLAARPFEQSEAEGFKDYRWYTQQEEGNTLIFANFHDAVPNESCVEINVRRNCFYPDKSGVNYITLSGFDIRQAATTWAPPTAYQEGMVGPRWSKGWIIEDCEISNSKCVGISLGKYLQTENENKWSLKRYKHGTQNERDAICQAVNEGWSKETVGSHVIRRCNIHDCEQAGIVGHLGGAFCVIENNHIHDINMKQQLAGAEIAGIKLHAAIDTIIRCNHIHNCYRGIWLDWQAQGTRISQNFFHNNYHPKPGDMFGSGEDVFVEVSHGPTIIDNNVMLSECACRLSTQGVALIHNLICGSFTAVGEGVTNGNSSTNVRYTPYHVPHSTLIAGFMTFLHGDMRFYNNIFVQQEYDEKLLNKEPQGVFGALNMVCGTMPYNGYPLEEEFRSLFLDENDRGWLENRDKYYTKLPIYIGGNVYCNGAVPCDREKDYAVIKEKVFLKLEEKNGLYELRTNLYETLPDIKGRLISTGVLGEAFEPEQLFENPDGTPIFFDRDYFGEKRGIFPIPGPFEDFGKGRCINADCMAYI